MDVTNLCLSIFPPLSIYLEHFRASQVKKFRGHLDIAVFHELLVAFPVLLPIHSLTYSMWEMLNAQIAAE